VVLLVAVAIAGLVVVSIQGCNQHYAVGRARIIGQDLIATTNSSYLVRLEEGLRGRLSELLASRTEVAYVSLGDAPRPIGDGRAQVVLFLRNSTGALLGIRLRKSRQPDKFDVLGFWTPRPEELKGVQ
jgi:hypothetical protein